MNHQTVYPKKKDKKEEKREDKKGDKDKDPEKEGEKEEKREDKKGDKDKDTEKEDKKGDKDEDVIQLYLRSLFKSNWFRGDELNQISKNHQGEMGKILKKLHELIEDREALLKEEKDCIEGLAKINSDLAQSNEKAIQDCIDELAKVRFQEAESNERETQNCINKLVAKFHSRKTETDNKIAGSGQNLIKEPNAELVSIKAFCLEELKLDPKFQEARQNCIEDPDAKLRSLKADCIKELKLNAIFHSQSVKNMEEREKYKEKIKQDYQRFLEERKRANETISKKNLERIPVLRHDEFWGTRQQLRCGKVVGDMLGGLDPVFGVLLNPTGGRIGPGNARTLHKWLFRDGTPLAFHAAVHDAFGYLRQHHDFGPGYNYLTMKKFSEFPLAGQLAGIIFWRKVFEQLRN